MLKLYGRPTSGRTQKVLWTLAEIGMDFEFVLANAQHIKNVPRRRPT